MRAVFVFLFGMAFFKSLVSRTKDVFFAVSSSSRSTMQVEGRTESEQHGEIERFMDVCVYEWNSSFCPEAFVYFSVFGHGRYVSVVHCFVVGP
jgi:hypothetical protein